MVTSLESLSPFSQKLMQTSSLSFDDVLIEPSYSDIESRSEIDISTPFLGWHLSLPIISANMDYITGGDMAVAMMRAGGFYILHRFHDSLEDAGRDYTIIINNGLPISLSVGVREELGNYRSAYCVTIDVAHGHHQKVADRIKELKDQGVRHVIAGNVATAQGAAFLARAGADAIKVGIGPGSVCTTREVTGVGVPQLSAIMDCARATDTPIIADGGIKNSGDIVKAIAAGADVVMIGSLLAGTNEAPGDVRIDPNGVRWKPYRGQSIFGANASHYTPEGVEGWVREKGPVADVLRSLAGGIRSGLSYVGARNLKELRERANFIQVTQATHLESGIRVQTNF